MKRIQTQLKTISKSLVSLSQQVEKITKQVDKLQPAKKATPARRKKAVRKTAARRKPSRGRIRRQRQSVALHVVGGGLSRLGGIAAVLAGCPCAWGFLHEG